MGNIQYGIFPSKISYFSIIHLKEMKRLFLTIVGIFAELRDLQFPRFNQTCDSFDSAKKCEISCENILTECAYECQNDECIDKCKNEFYECTEECPCHAKCPLGCLDCSNWACQSECSDPDANPDKLKVFLPNQQFIALL